MWAKSFSSVKYKIARCLKRVTDYIGILKGAIGEGIAGSVNHLMCDYREGSFFTSQYVAKQVLGRGGHEAVRLAYGIAAGLNNPSFTGWVVEMDFLNQVVDANSRRNGLEVIHEVRSETGVTEHKERWEVNRVIDKLEVVKDHFEKVSEQLVDGCWILPAKWNQAGYDLVCLLAGNSNGGDGQKKFMIRFIQLTRAVTHDFNLHHFEDFATCLIEALKCEVTGIEIVVIVPSGITETSVRIKNGGRLAHFKMGYTNTLWGTNAQPSQIQIRRFGPPNHRSIVMIGS
jgi:hypothetical protein